MIRGSNHVLVAVFSVSASPEREHRRAQDYQAECISRCLHTHEKLFEVVTNSSGQCWAISNYAPVPGLLENVPANNNYKPGFTAAMMLKDLRLSQQSAASVGLKTPMGEQATALYQAFNDDKMGGLDFSAIIKLLQ